jgi:hypothetical protein
VQLLLLSIKLDQSSALEIHHQSGHSMHLTFFAGYEATSPHQLA